MIAIYRIVLVRFGLHLALGVMQRKGVKIFLLVLRNPDSHFCRLVISANNNAEIICKEFLGNKFCRQFVILVGLDHIEHPLVQSIDSGLIFPFTLCQHIPTLLEQFQAVRLCRIGVGLIPPKTLVCHLDDLAVTHGVHND